MIPVFSQCLKDDHVREYFAGAWLKITAMHNLFVRDLRLAFYMDVR